MHRRHHSLPLFFLLTLLVTLAGGGGFGGCTRAALKLLCYPDDHLCRLELTLSRAVDELGERCLEFGDLPPSAVSVTVIFLRRTCLRIVATFFTPCGRPRGLPDWPFINWPRLGGFL